MTTEYYVVEMSQVNSFARYTGIGGLEERARFMDKRIGPFSNVNTATDWLSKNAKAHCGYAIEEVASPTFDGDVTKSCCADEKAK